jgi:hypothetical protein
LRRRNEEGEILGFSLLFSLLWACEHQEYFEQWWWVYRFDWSFFVSFWLAWCVSVFFCLYYGGIVGFFFFFCFSVEGAL